MRIRKERGARFDKPSVSSELGGHRRPQRMSHPFNASLQSSAPQTISSSSGIVEPPLQRPRLSIAAVARGSSSAISVASTPPMVSQSPLPSPIPSVVSVASSPPAPPSTSSSSKTVPHPAPPSIVSVHSSKPPSAAKQSSQPKSDRSRTSVAARRRRHVVVVVDAIDNECTCGIRVQGFRQRGEE